MMDENNEEVYLRPSWRCRWKSLLFIVVLFAVDFKIDNPWINLLTPVLLIVILSNLLIWKYSRRYMIGPMGVERHEGIISRDMTRIEYRHIRGANMKRSVADRILGLGTITVATSGLDEDLRISCIRKPQYHTELIISRLKGLR